MPLTNTILSLMIVLFSIPHINSMSRVPYLNPNIHRGKVKLTNEQLQRIQTTKPKQESETSLIPIETKTSANEKELEVKMIVAKITDVYVKAIQQCRFAIEQHSGKYNSYPEFFLANIKKDFNHNIEQIKLQHPGQNFDSLPDIQLIFDDQYNFLFIFQFLWNCSKKQQDQCYEQYTKKLPIPGMSSVTVDTYIANNALNQNLVNLYPKWSTIATKNPTTSHWFEMLKEILDNLMTELQKLETSKEQKKQEEQEKAKQWFWQRWLSWLRK